MKDPLQRFTIAVTGDFGPQRGHEKIRQWVEANGGTFAFHLGPEVTHLICSRKHFKRGVAMGMSYSVFSYPIALLHIMIGEREKHRLTTLKCFLISPRGPQD